MFLIYINDIDDAAELMDLQSKLEENTRFDYEIGGVFVKETTFEKDLGVI